MATRVYKSYRRSPEIKTSSSFDPPPKPQKAPKVKTPPWDRARHNRMARYGLSEEKYQEMLKEQKNCCAICSVSFELGKIHVDHCHTTGRVRGLLCHMCNRALGMLKDSPDLLQKALDYLKE